MAASAVSRARAWVAPISNAIAEEKPGSSFCDFHSRSPVLLFSATTAAVGPPGIAMRQPPSTSGDSLYPDFGGRPPKRSTRFIPQTRLPAAVSRHTSVPSADKAYRRAPSTVGVPRGPFPCSASLYGLPAGVFQSCLPV